MHVNSLDDPSIIFLFNVRDTLKFKQAYLGIWDLRQSSVDSNLQRSFNSTAQDAQQTYLIA